LVQFKHVTNKKLQEALINYPPHFLHALEETLNPSYPNTYRLQAKNIILQSLTEEAEKSAKHSKILINKLELAVAKRTLYTELQKDVIKIQKEFDLLSKNHNQKIMKAKQLGYALGQLEAHKHDIEPDPELEQELAEWIENSKKTKFVGLSIQKILSKHGPKKS
jgi:hypothetical protein